jgi:hypothetical protein
MQNMMLLFYKSFFGSFFESDLIGVTALSLSAVGGLNGESGIANSANLFLTVVFLCQSLKSGFHSAT